MSCKEGRKRKLLEAFTLMASPVRGLRAIRAERLEIVKIVAVTESGDVIPPCGMCRELISDYAPDAEVILSTPSGLRTVSVADLIPEKIALSSLPNRREP